MQSPKDENVILVSDISQDEYIHQPIKHRSTAPINSIPTFDLNQNRRSSVDGGHQQVRPSLNINLIPCYSYGYDGDSNSTGYTTPLHQVTGRLTPSILKRNAPIVNKSISESVLSSQKSVQFGEKTVTIIKSFRNHSKDIVKDHNLENETEEKKGQNVIENSKKKIEQHPFKNDIADKKAVAIGNAGSQIANLIARLKTKNKRNLEEIAEERTSSNNLDRYMSENEDESNEDDHNLSPNMSAKGRKSKTNRSYSTDKNNHDAKSPNKNDTAKSKKTLIKFKKIQRNDYL